MELLIPFANTGEKEDFSTTTDPTGKVSLEKGFTELYELKPEEGGLFILRKVFNQMMNLVTTDTVNWKTQTFPNWIADKGDELPFAYPKNALVKYTDGNTYVSKVDNNTAVPTDTNNWVNFEDFGSLNINGLTEKTTPSDTDNIALQEVGGLFKKLSFANLKNWILSLFQPTLTGTATFTATDNKIVMTGIVNALDLEVGDVIQFISGTDANNAKMRTVESITDNNTIIVNYEHCGARGNGSLKLSDQSGISCTVKRIAKYYNCSDSLGRDWVDIKAFRVKNANYKNNIKRPYEVQITTVCTNGTNIALYIDNVIALNDYNTGSNTDNTVYHKLIPNKEIKILDTPTNATVRFWQELR